MPAIYVERTPPGETRGPWRAVIRLPRSVDWKHVGYVMGQSTDEGPWTEGYGSSPEHAIQTAMTAIGRAIVQLIEHEPPRETNDARS